MTEVLGIYIFNLCPPLSIPGFFVEVFFYLHSTHFWGRNWHLLQVSLALLSVFPHFQPSFCFHRAQAYVCALSFFPISSSARSTTDVWNQYWNQEACLCLLLVVLHRPLTHPRVPLWTGGTQHRSQKPSVCGCRELYSCVWAFCVCDCMCLFELTKCSCKHICVYVCVWECDTHTYTHVFCVCG